jgi:hypothetical protein
MIARPTALKLLVIAVGRAYYFDKSLPVTDLEIKNGAKNVFATYVNK